MSKSSASRPMLRPPRWHIPTRFQNYFISPTPRRCSLTSRLSSLQIGLIGYPSKMAGWCHWNRLSTNLKPPLIQVKAFGLMEQRVFLFTVYLFDLRISRLILNGHFYSWCQSAYIHTFSSIEAKSSLMGFDICCCKVMVVLNPLGIKLGVSDGTRMLSQRLVILWLWSILLDQLALDKLVLFFDVLCHVCCFCLTFLVVVMGHSLGFYRFDTWELGWETLQGPCVPFLVSEV